MSSSLVCQLGAHHGMATSVVAAVAALACALRGRERAVRVGVSGACQRDVRVGQHEAHGGER